MKDGSRFLLTNIFGCNMLSAVRLSGFFVFFRARFCLTTNSALVLYLQHLARPERELHRQFGLHCFTPCSLKWT